MDSIDIINQIFLYSSISNKSRLISLNHEAAAILQPQIHPFKYLDDIKKNKRCRGRFVFNRSDFQQCRMKRRGDSIYCPLCAYISF